MNEWVELADGTIVENAYVVYLDSATIAIYVKGQHTIREMKTWFDVQKRTKVINSNQYGDKQTWVGFTELVHVECRDSEAYVCLKKPE